LHERGEAGYRFAFVVGQTLGNAVFSQNLRTVVDRDEEVEATWYFVDYPAWAGVRTPGSPTAEQPTSSGSRRRPGTAKKLVRRVIGGRRTYEPWAAWASGQALRMLGRDLFEHRHDAILFHATSTALFAGPLLGRRSLISLDATPAGSADSPAQMGRPYGRLIGGASEHAHVRAYRSVRALTPFSRWAESSLVLDYGVGRDRITVIPPGIDLVSWRPGARRDGAGPVRLLFVGRDFERKGGDVLLRAFTEHLEPGRYELDVVTKASLPTSTGIRVYHDLPANGDQLRNLYARADIFVFPTRWDTFGIAAIEAMAAGLPVVASDLNALPEIVSDGSSGLLVPQDDPASLAQAIDRLGQNPELRRKLGEEGRRLAEQRFDLSQNARRLLQVMKRVALEDRSSRREPSVSEPATRERLPL
jgi:glycosyltransferase involved in cell wall biosynthesis